MKSDERILQLPQPIVDRLREVTARIRRLQMVRGSLFTLAAAVLAILGVVAVDALFSMESRWLRLAVSLGALALTAWVAWVQWLRPLTRRIPLTAVARWVETRHPEMQERISTAVELLDPQHGADDQGSRELLEAVVADAVTDVSRMDPAQELSAKRARPSKIVAGVAVGLLVVLVAIWPDQVPRLLARALAPLSETGNTWAGSLRVLTKSQVVAAGEPASVEVALSGKAERVELQMTGSGGQTMVEVLSPDAGVPLDEGESGYALRLPALRDGFTGKVIAGKAVSAPFTLTVLPRPESGSPTVVYDYPDYMGLEDKTVPAASGEIIAPAGTQVTVRLPLNRPVAKALVRIADEDIPGVVIDSASNPPSVEWTLEMTPGLDALWSLHLEDEHGMVNRPVDWPVRSLADSPPVITLDSPAEDQLKLRPVEKLPMTYTIREDIGLSEVRIRIRPREREEYLLPAEILPEKVTGSADEYTGTAVLDLSKVLVPENHELRVSLMTADVLPEEMGGPQRAWSREITIQLDRHTTPLVEKNFREQHEELRREIEEVKRGLQSAKGRMNDKPDRLRQEDRLSDGTLKDLEESARHMAEAKEMLEALTERMKETAYARQTPALENIAQEMVSPALEKTQEIPLTDQKEERGELAKSSKSLLETAIQKLEEEQRQMDQDRQSVQQIAKLSDIAEQQQRLAEEAQAAAGMSQAPAADDSADGDPANPADPASAADGADPSQEPGAETAQTASASPDASSAPTADEQKKWLEEQRRVAERAKQLRQENENSNPLALQEQLRQAAGQASQLAAEAAKLAEQEKNLAQEFSAESTPEAREQNSSAQQQIASKVASLQEKTRNFQESSARQIDQSTATQKAAHQARSHLAEAADAASESGAELTAAAKSQSAPASPAADPQPTADPASPAGENESENGNTDTATAPDSPSPGSSPGESPDSTGPASSPSSQDAATAQETADSGSPAPADAAASPAAPGQEPALKSAQELAAAAESLSALGTELQTLAGMIGGHSESLAKGAQQAGSAVDQAAEAQQQSGKSPSMQQGAEAATAAAEQLTMAANTAMQAMSIPAKAKSSKPSSQKGKGQPRQGPPNPAPPGQEGKEGIQMDMANSLLPEELAKLGLTQDDWMKLRSSLGGVEGAQSSQIPAEYRELVKAYFGALAKGEKRP